MKLKKPEKITLITQSKVGTLECPKCHKTLVVIHKEVGKKIKHAIREIGYFEKI